MNLGEQMIYALNRGGQGDSLEDVLELTDVRIHEFAGCSASWAPIGGRMFICHVWGKWSPAVAAFFLWQLGRDAAELGVSGVQWEGRRGWARFLRSKGYGRRWRGNTTDQFDI